MQRPERERKEPTEFNVIVKAKDLVKHTFTITNSTERYPKKYRFTLVNRIQDKAVDVYECVLEANELDLRDAQEYRQRQKLQAKALTALGVQADVDLASGTAVVTGNASDEALKKAVTDAGYEVVEIK